MKRIGLVVALGFVLLEACDRAPQLSGDASMFAAAALSPSSGRSGETAQDSTPMVVRRVWGGPDVDLFGRVSPDGRHLTFIDWTSGNVAVRELATGEVRLVTEDGSWEPYASAFEATVSPDGKEVAYLQYSDDRVSPYELRVVGMDGSGGRVLYQNDSASWFGVGVWSPDGEQILTGQSNVDGSREMVLISVVDGSSRTVKQLEFGPGGLSFSPDGRFVAYHSPLRNRSDQRDIFVLPVDGGPEVPVVQHPADDVVLGWAPDGEHILFASDRTGTVGAWLLPVANGEPAGEPKLVKPDMWRVWPLGFTRDGSFFYGVNLNARDVYVATLDPETGELLAPPASINLPRLAHDYRPVWSPDGRYVGYASGFGARIGTAFTRVVYSIRSVETGETRELVPALSRFGRFLWWTNSHTLLASGADLAGRRGVFKVDLQTGEAEPFSAFWGVNIARLIDPSPDGNAIFYTKWSGGRRQIAVMDLESGQERVLFRDQPGAVALSHDGRFLAFPVQTDNTHRLLVMPAAGGEPRELQRYEAEGRKLGAIAWSRDGKWVLYTTVNKDVHQLWRVSVLGGPPQKLDVAMESVRNLRVHPDGRRIAFDAGSGGAEVWVMEDFLPSPSADESEHDEDRRVP